MHSMNSYRMIQRYQEERQRQAEYGRMIQRVKGSQRHHWEFHRKFALWFGTHMVRWGQRLEHFGSLEAPQLSPSASPHH